MNTICFHKNFFNIPYPIGCSMGRVVEYVELVVPHILKTYAEVGQGKRINVWVRGSSGAILAGMLFPRLPEPKRHRIIYTRKEGEKSHSFYMRDGQRADDYNIVIDDFAESGSTIEAISREAQESIKKIDILCLSTIGVLDFDNILPVETLITSHEAKIHWLTKIKDMFRSLFIIIMLSVSFTAFGQKAAYKPNCLQRADGTYVDIKAVEVPTDFVYMDKDSNMYRVYQTVSGKMYIKRVNKTGKQYRYYLKPAKSF